MKKMRKIMSLLLAMIMVFAMTTTAFAEGTHTITLNTEMPKHTYSAYQIFSGELSDGKLINIEWGSGIDETKTANIIEDLKNEGIAITGDTVTAADVAKALEGKEYDSVIMQAVAKVFGKYLSNVATPSTEKTVTDEKGITKTTGYEISGLTDGYYLVKDTGEVADDSAYTRYILKVVKDVNTTVKASVPSITKKIVGEQGPVDANNASVGQVVSYQISGEVPDYTGYNKYYYIINDTLSNGLTFNDDIKVTVNGVETEEYILDKTAHSFKLSFNNIKNFEIGDEILVTYSATVNDNAVIGSTGNPNTVNLTYSNNPNFNYNGTPDNPNENDPVGVTPDDKTITYVAEIEITKTDDKNAPLSGAEFTLTGTSKQVVLAGGTYYVQNDEGEYYLLKDGTYTKDDPNAEGMDKSKYVSTTVKYSEETVAEKTTIATPVKMVATSGADGKLVFKGLGEGTYTIEETVVPDGYNKAENIIVDIDCEEPAEVITGTETAEWSIGDETVGEVTLKDVDEATATATAGVYQTTIINRSGAVLPETGGIGTTIFYVVGAVLVLGAAVLLVTRKRMSR